MSSLHVRLLREALSEGLSPGLAERVRRAVEKRKAPRKTLPGKSRAQVREERREAHARETAEIRSDRLLFCRGVCEMCLQPGTEANPLQMHHTKSGSGRRRQQQSVENVRMLHLGCHRDLHDGRRTLVPLAPAVPPEAP